MGRTSGFRECPLTLCDAWRNLSSVRRREPTEPQASAERCERGKPEGKPQGRTGGSRENAARRDRGKGADPVRGALPEWVRGSVLRWSVVRTRWLPWSRRGRPGQGLSDTTPARRQRVIVDVAPRSTGGFGRTVTRGCVASGHLLAMPLPSAPVTTLRDASRALRSDPSASTAGLSAGTARGRPGARLRPPGG